MHDTHKQFQSISFHNAKFGIPMDLKNNSLIKFPSLYTNQNKLFKYKKHRF